MRTAGVETNAAPRWSPDGNRIGYIAPTEDGFALWLASLDGRAEPIPATVGAINFGWYLDGEHVILSRIAKDGAREMFVMNLVSGKQRILHRTEGKGIWHVHNGGWFPDSESVVYTRDTDQADIFLVETR